MRRGTSGAMQGAHLDLSSNKLGWQAAEQLASALPHLRSVWYLNLFLTNLCDASAGALAEVSWHSA